MSNAALSHPQPSRPSRIIRTGPGEGRPQTSEFSALLATVRDAGLLRRRPGFYIAVFAILVALTGGAIAGIVLLHESWLILLVAAGLGVLFTQFAFLAHEAAHRQVFESHRANEFSGRLLADFVVGISYSWWMNKHTRHHGNPNTVGKDPDIEPDVVMFRTEDTEKVTGRVYSWLLNRQAWFFFPLLLLEGVNLHRHAFTTVFSAGKVDKRALSISLLVARNIVYLSLLFWLLPPGMAVAFLGVQMAVFGLYMGSSFAPNHIGMAVLPATSRIDFLRRQVLTSRNITGGWWMTAFMGGLNFQVEHHLFPSMPRPHLRRANEIVREYCEARSVRYTENPLPTAWRVVLRYLDRVGLAAGVAAFDCPTAMRYGR
ncbi:acyl-CoA desaturase [Galbitalea sp. SE-J8]|uniref:fatty acid desaturase family protein n=1 Tax=Galbitalea sp. SE-J8 TaxID=3054952 RepID=UPI00259D1604|nr:acyl-CoA desaturase [Galbitalea sp. SE-J8]MDM4763153.1 acyl-CoA desaturase [Galbitalea sp. SE-J8]